MTAAKPAIPIFKLYGETASWPVPDLIHCESIAERSRLHDWEIKPHRHTDLLQLLYFQQGEAFAILDGEQLALQPPCILLIAPMCVHSFWFSQQVEGVVLSLAAPLLQRLSATLGDQQAVLLESRCFPVKGQRQVLDTLFTTISAEYAENLAGRELLLNALMDALLVLLARQTEVNAESGGLSADPGSLHFSHFCRLLEQRYRSHCALKDYASALGISAAHLNSLCRRFSQRSALQLIHDRLLLEAKRNLMYTSMTINTLSDSLGFSEPAYFTRFFKRLTGISPKAFRSQHCPGTRSP